MDKTVEKHINNIVLSLLPFRQLSIREFTNIDDIKSRVMTVNKCLIKTEPSNDSRGQITECFAYFATEQLTVGTIKNFLSEIENHVVKWVIVHKKTLSQKMIEKLAAEIPNCYAFNSSAILFVIPKHRLCGQPVRQTNDPNNPETDLSDSQPTSGSVIPTRVKTVPNGNDLAIVRSDDPAVLWSGARVGEFIKYCHMTHNNPVGSISYKRVVLITSE